MIRQLHTRGACGRFATVAPAGQAAAGPVGCGRSISRMHVGVQDRGQWLAGDVERLRYQLRTGYGKDEKSTPTEAVPGRAANGDPGG